MKRANIIISLLVIVFGLVAYWYTSDFPGSSGSETGPGFMPKIFIIIIILGISLLIKSIFFENEKATLYKKRIAIFILLFIIYNILIPILGFYVTSILFLISLLWMNNIKKLVYFFFVPLGVVTFIFIFFQTLLKVPLPTGVFL